MRSKQDCKTVGHYYVNTGCTIREVARDLHISKSYVFTLLHACITEDPALGQDIMRRCQLNIDHGRILGGQRAMRKIWQKKKSE